MTHDEAYLSLLLIGNPLSAMNIPELSSNSSPRSPKTLAS